MRRCGMCGSTNLKVENIKGSHHPWRDHLSVELTHDQEVPVCQNCKNMVMSSKNIIELDSNIRKSLWDKVKFAINKLTQDMGLSQEELAEALGLTPQYISNVKNGKKVFSFTAFNLLMSYAEHPELIKRLAGININPKYIKETDIIFFDNGEIAAATYTFKSGTPMGRIAAVKCVAPEVSKKIESTDLFEKVYQRIMSDDLPQDDDTEESSKSNRYTVNNRIVN